MIRRLRPFLRPFLRPLLRFCAPPLLRAARGLGLPPLPFVPQGALHPPGPAAAPGQGGLITGWAAPARASRHPARAPRKMALHRPETPASGLPDFGPPDFGAPDFGRPASGARRVGLFWRGVLVAETLACRPRPEIAALGLAPAACGVLMPWPADLDLDLDRGGAPLILHRLDAALTPLATWPPGQPLPLPPGLAPGLAPGPAPDLAPGLAPDPMLRLRPLLARAARSAPPETGPGPAPLTPRQRRLFETMPGGQTAYLAHALLHRGDAVSPGSGRDPDAALRGYLAGYAADRAATGLAAPLSAADLARLRAMAPKDTGALCAWLTHGPGALAPETFIALAPETFTALAPETFTAQAPDTDAGLAALTAPVGPGPWPLSLYTLWLLADRPAFAAVLDPATAAHRRLWALSLMTEGGLPAALLPPGTRDLARADLPAFRADLAGGAAPLPAVAASLTAEGHRLAAPALSGGPGSAPRPGIADVQIIGPFSRASGLGQAARATAAALATTGLALRLVDATRDHPTPGGAAGGLSLAPAGAARVTLLHQNLDEIPATLAYGPDPAPGPGQGRGGTLIGFGFWELDRAPADHALGLRLIDRLWAASPFGRDIYLGHPDAPPIDVVPLPVLLPDRLPSRAQARARLAARLGADLGGTCVFFASFDSYSFIARKNPGAVVAAFRAAFPDTGTSGRTTGRPTVRLVLKTHNRAAIGDPAQIAPWRALMAAVAADRRITLIDETLPFADLLALKAGADAYVSLHRAEGWGFGLIEAAALGLPVVATGWSGNLAFMDAATAHLVAARLVPVPPEAYLRVPAGALWADPDAAAAAAALRTVAAQPEAARALGAAARTRILRDFSPQAVGAGHLARLAPLLTPILDTPVQSTTRDG